jgi:hypothetical protein
MRNATFVSVLLLLCIQSAAERSAPLRFDAADPHSDAAGAGGLLQPASEDMGCQPRHFLVPLFGGQIASASNITVMLSDGGASSLSGTDGGGDGSSYHTSSDEAHIILGVLLLCMVFAWAGLVMDFIRIRTAARISGTCQMMMGVYLMSWCFFFMFPTTEMEKLRQLWEYSTRDMLQLQHIAIALLLCAGGLIELLQSLSLLEPMSLPVSTSAANGSAPAGSQLILNGVRISSAAGSHWHMLWCINLILTGIVFQMHSQHSFRAGTQHLLLGLSLVLGGPLHTRAKMISWKYEFSPRPYNYTDWSMIIAGGCFAVASCILLVFREKETPVHIGTTKDCQPAFVICVIAYICAAGTIVAATIAAAQQRHRRKLREMRRRMREQDGGPEAAGARISPRDSPAPSGSPAPSERGRVAGWLSRHSKTLLSRLRRSAALRRFGLVADEEKEGMVTLEMQISQSDGSPILDLQPLPSSIAESNGTSHRAVSNSSLRATYSVPDPVLDGLGREESASLDAEQSDEESRERERDRRRREDYTGEEEGEREVL